MRILLVFLFLGFSLTSFAGTCKLTKKLGPKNSNIASKFMSTLIQVENNISIRDCIGLASEEVGNVVDRRSQRVMGGISKKNNLVKYVLYKYTYKNGKSVFGRIEK